MCIRDSDDTARMLTRGSLNTHAALDNPVDLTFSLSLAPLFVEILHIAVCGLIRQRADGARAEGITLAEDDLGVVVGLALVLAGKVQVDIRLLVALKSQESFKRDVKAVLFQRFPANRCV